MISLSLVIIPNIFAIYFDRFFLFIFITLIIYLYLIFLHSRGLQNGFKKFNIYYLIALIPPLLVTGPFLPDLVLVLIVIFFIFKKNNLILNYTKIFFFLKYYYFLPYIILLFQFSLKIFLFL